MDLLVLILEVNAALIEEKDIIYHECLTNTNDLLKVIIDDYKFIPKSYLYRHIVCKYGRLRKVTETLTDLNIDDFEIPPMISYLLHDVYNQLRL